MFNLLLFNSTKVAPCCYLFFMPNTGPSVAFKLSAEYFTMLLHVSSITAICLFDHEVADKM